MSGGITTNNLGLFMRKYKSTPLNVEAFILTLEGVSLNATASRIGLSSGRVRYALHSECQIRCPKLYQSLIKHKLTPHPTNNYYCCGKGTINIRENV